MKIDWASLGLVAVTTVVAAVSIVGIFALGVAALTHHPAGQGTTRGSAVARAAGYACIGIAGLIALYGIYLIVPAFH